MKKNYQKELEKLIQQLEQENRVPSLLLHSCCAPCSSYVLEYLSRHFKITLFYYNPNIYPPEEYSRRAQEQQQLIHSLPQKYPIQFMEGNYEPSEFYAITNGLAQVPEGGERCFLCYELRLRQAARKAQELGFEFFTTTLSISPHKNAERLNEIGERLSLKYAVTHLPSDFKKKGGYQRSIQLSREYQLYRQDYCGCVYSKNHRKDPPSPAGRYEVPEK